MGARSKGEIVLNKDISSLTAKEKKIYQEALVIREPALGVDTSIRLFEMFLQGKSCEEIAQYNPGISIGSIIRARVEYGWDQKKLEYVDKLYAETADRLKQTALESVNFIGDMMAATHKFHGEKLRRYLASGNVSDLPEEFTISSVKEYKSLIETLLKISGAENKKEIKYSGEVKTKKEVSFPQAGKNLSGFSPAALLELIDGKEESDES